MRLPARCFAVSLTLLAATSSAADFPAWAYPVPEPGYAPAPDDGKGKRVPDSDIVFTRKDLAGHAGRVPDWHPDEHPAMPAIVERGREPKVWACGYCHLPTGDGRPENASLSGLSAVYIKQQLLNFKNGARNGSEPHRAPQNFMIGIARESTDAEDDQAAAYFASIKPKGYIRVEEATEVPRTFVAGSMLAKTPDGATEPLGNRIIEVPDDLVRAELRDSRTTYVAYVPAGSIDKGRELALTGNGGKTPTCASCHGPELKGLVDVPRLAGRSPSYLMRQLYDIRAGTRSGTAEPMKPIVAQLTDDDLVNLCAYLASLSP